MSEGLSQLLMVSLQSLAVIGPVMLAVAYLTYAERRIIGWIQGRVGPNRVGPFGLLQPFADAAKLLFKEIVSPQQSNRYLHIIAPTFTIGPALAAWAVVPFSENFVMADINVGLLYLLAMTSLGVYGVIVAGWASNSKYAMLGALRSAAQVVSYEIAMGFCLVGVLLVSNSLNLQTIIAKQAGGALNWNFIPLFPLFIIYWISAVAETNRAPFDVAEGESEIVAGFHVEYAGMAFAVFFLAEYANMILLGVLAAILFLGGWLSPFEGVPLLNEWLAFVPGTVWLLLKAGLFIFTYLWFRATFPRYRYDQIMRLGWKVFIPVTFFWCVVVAVMAKWQWGPWFQ